MSTHTSNVRPATPARGTSVRVRLAAQVDRTSVLLLSTGTGLLIFALAMTLRGA